MESLTEDAGLEWTAALRLLARRHPHYTAASCFEYFRLLARLRKGEATLEELLTS